MQYNFLFVRLHKAIRIIKGKVAEGELKEGRLED
jgi:hypothetical protein